eukprot:TRINITY_DN1768_c0_g1_i10.p1 TRINITY_DN1768_c0_g1~~TRINITY_DN1768_c0_g1_i10.p1  ORF type:complete len:1878 (+),score=320.33 TRINITY_DN1768_c0_g1_i10:740-5635(+)
MVECPLYSYEVLQPVQPEVAIVAIFGGYIVSAECINENFSLVNGHSSSVTFNSEGVHEYSAFCLGRTSIPSVSVEGVLKINKLPKVISFCFDTDLGVQCDWRCPNDSFVEQLKPDNVVADSFLLSASFNSSGEFVTKARCVGYGYIAGEMSVVAISVISSHDAPLKQLTSVLGGIILDLICSNGKVCNSQGKPTMNHFDLLSVGNYQFSSYCCDIGHEISPPLGVVIELTQLSIPTVECVNIIGGQECEWNCIEGDVFIDDVLIEEPEIYKEKGSYYFEGVCRAIGKADSTETIVSFEIFELLIPTVECVNIIGGQECEWNCIEGDVFIDDVLIEEPEIYKEKGSYYFEGVCRAIGKADSTETIVSFEIPKSEEPIVTYRAYPDETLVIGLCENGAEWWVFNEHMLEWSATNTMTLKNRGDFVVSSLCRGSGFQDSDVKKSNIEVTVCEVLFQRENLIGVEGLPMEIALEGYACEAIPYFSCNVTFANDSECIIESTELSFSELKGKVASMVYQTCDDDWYSGDFSGLVSLNCPIGLIERNFVVVEDEIETQGILSFSTDRIIYGAESLPDNIKVSVLNKNGNTNCTVNFLFEGNVEHFSLPTSNSIVWYEGMDSKQSLSFGVDSDGEILSTLAIHLDNPMGCSLDTSKATCLISIDTVRPSVTFIVEPAMSIIGPETFDLMVGCSKANCTFFCKVGDVAFDMCESTINFETDYLEEIHFYIFAVDDVGNKGVVVERIWQIDRIPPDVVVSQLPSFSDPELIFSVENDGALCFDCLVKCKFDTEVIVECASFQVLFDNLITGSYNLLIEVEDEYGNRDVIIVVWIMEEFFPQLQIDDDVLGSVSLNIEEGGVSNAFGVFLSASPLEDELVNLLCHVSDSRLEVIGLPIEFSATNFDAAQPIFISVASNHITYDGGIGFVTCSCVSSLSDGYFFNSTSEVSFEVLITDIALPLFDDISVLIANDSFSGVTDTGFSLSIAGDETLQILAADGVRFEEGTIVRVNDLVVTIVQMGSDACTVKLNGDDYKDILNEYVSVSVQLPSTTNSVGKTVSCPPNCPGKGGSGLYVTKKCIGEKWLEGLTCFELETAYLCGLGIGHECQECPNGGICPGGFRIWPFPSFWSDNVLSIPERCRLPEERCQGWDISKSVSICGEGYKGIKCESCALGYYSNSQRLCQKCPNEDVLGHLLPFVWLVIFILFLFFVWFLLVLIVQQRFGGTLKAGFQRAMQFSIWVALCLQFIGQIARAHHGNSPRMIQWFFEFVLIFQLEPVIIHPDCLDSTVLFLPICVCACSITMMFIFIISWKFGKAKMTYHVCMLLTLMYALAANSSWDLMSCKCLDNVWRLALNLEIECWAGDMIGLHLIGICVFLLHGLAFPLISFHCCKKILKRLVKKDINGNDHLNPYTKELNLPDNDKEVALWWYFFANDFKAKFFHFRHLNFLFFLVTTICTRLEGGAVLNCIVNSVLLAVLTVCFAKKQPFLTPERWKLPPKVICLVLGALTSILSWLTVEFSPQNLFVEYFATTVLLCCLLLFVVLFVSFWVVLVEGARSERSEKEVLASLKSQRVRVIEFQTNPMIAAVSKKKPYERQPVHVTSRFHSECGMPNLHKLNTMIKNPGFPLAVESWQSDSEDF